MVEPNKPSQEPIPGLEASIAEDPSVAAARIGANAHPTYKPDVHSEATYDQGKVHQEKGKPVSTEDRPVRTEAAIAEERRKRDKRLKRLGRNREGAHSDVHSDEVDPDAAERLAVRDAADDPIDPAERLTADEAKALMRRKNTGAALARIVAGTGVTRLSLARATAYGDRNSVQSKPKDTPDSV